MHRFSVLRFSITVLAIPSSSPVPSCVFGVEMFERCPGAFFLCALLLVTLPAAVPLAFVPLSFFAPPALGALCPFVASCQRLHLPQALHQSLEPTKMLAPQSAAGRSGKPSGFFL